MTVFMVDIPVRFQHTDPAGIVFYPNYFRWFDNAFHHLLRQCGIGQRTLVERFDTLGTPIADTGARFLRPASYGDEITIHTVVEEWRRKMFRTVILSMRWPRFATAPWMRR